MKLPNQTHGPVTLTKIEYYPRMSEETTAFVAKVEINGLVGTAKNEGQGGPTFVMPRSVEQAIEAYAKTLPPDAQFGLTYSADLLISEMVEEAAVKVEAAKEHRKMALKGFTHYCEWGVRGVYAKGTPTVEGLVKKFGEEARSARIQTITA